MRTLLAAALLACAGLAAAQDSLDGPATEPPRIARFEIIQPGATGQPTFRLDRFTGQVSELQRGAGDNWQWNDLEVRGLDRISAARPRFQIVAPAAAAGRTFLIDTFTGRTWVSRQSRRRNPDGSLMPFDYWTPFQN